jgi:hypothetical protein
VSTLTTRSDAVDLLRDADVVAGSGLHAAYVDDRCALVDDAVHAVERGGEVVRGALVEERVRRTVHDRHDDRLVRRERTAAEPQLHRTSRLA